MAEFDNKKTSVLKVVIQLFALIAQISGFVVWPLVESGREASLWFIPLALFLISFGWWENFVSTTKAKKSDAQEEENKKPKKCTAPSLSKITSFILGVLDQLFIIRFYAFLLGRDQGKEQKVSLLHVLVHLCVEDANNICHHADSVACEWPGCRKPVQQFQHGSFTT